MSKELVIGSNRHETKVAILEDDQLVELYFQRANEYSLAGSIHKGRVTRVLPGMQSAFVDLGLERDTFLYVSDFFEEHPDLDTVAEERAPRGGRGEPRRDRERERAPEVRFVASEEPGAAKAPVAASEDVPVRETAPETEPRGEFQHDRRGRRSRRRRARGDGFPDTKYAQPGATTSVPHSAPVERQDEPESGEEASAGVIILPGESLRKYRHAAPAADEGPRAAESEYMRVEVHAPEGLEFAPEVDADEHTAAAHAQIVAEAEIAREAGLGHVSETPDAHYLHAHDVDAHDVDADDVDAHAVDADDADDEPEAPPPHKPEHRRRDDFALNLVSDFSAEATPVEAAPAQESRAEVEVLSEPESEPETEAEREADGETEGAPDSEASGSPEDQASARSGEQHGDEVAAHGDDASPRTASVREPGGRSMHRLSRRMRRRRGGRFNQPAEGSTSDGPATVAPVTAAAPAAAAPAVETRPETEPKPEREERAAKVDRPMPLISDLLKAGQEIIVQIAKEPLGQKGARITSHVALPGRFVVYMPSVEHLGVSRKIESDEERYRLKKILQAHREGTTGGFIIRTAGAGHTEEEIAADMNFLYNLWLDIRQKAEKRPAPLLLHHDLDVVQRILRDQVTDEFKAVWVDNEEMYESVLAFVQRFQPALVGRVKMYTRAAPIFDAFNITQELEKALRPKVWLKSGGYIVINQTEALVAIDVNTGKFVGKSNRLEDTIVKTNIEAVNEIVRQIRLRDLGGIIVVDFIDMDERKNRQKVMQALEEAMQADKAPNKILQFNDFGLVAITRKRVKQSLERTLCAPCPHCEGAGYVKSVQTVIGEILAEAQKIARAIDSKDAMLRCHPDVAKALKSKDNQYLEEIEEILGRPVLVRGDPQLHQEKFDLG